MANPIKKEPIDDHIFPSSSSSNTHLSSSSSTIKQENSSSSDAKMTLDDSDLDDDPSAFKPKSSTSNDDDDDDNLDLDTSKADTKVWLVRLPRFLLDKWSDPEKLNGQELGKVRIIKNGDSPDDKGEVKLLLDDNADTQDIPHEYTIMLTKQVVDNTYVFTEKDFPKYDKKKNHDGAEPSEGKPEPKSEPRPFESKSERFSKGKNGKDKSSLLAKDRFVPYVKTIPKRTALVGKVYHECNVIPNMTDSNYSRVITHRRQLQEEEPRAKVTLLSDPPGVTDAAFSLTLRSQSSQFMKAQKKESRANASEGKATRIPRNELLDVLFKLFESYQYWSLKGLKERTKQPEVYLKEVLEEIAVLNKKGAYSMRYSLKPELKYKVGEGSAGGEGSAEGEEGDNNDNDNDDDEDDDENIEMENCDGNSSLGSRLLVGFQHPPERRVPVLARVQRFQDPGQHFDRAPVEVLVAQQQHVGHLVLDEPRHGLAVAALAHERNHGVEERGREDRAVHGLLPKRPERVPQAVVDKAGEREQEERGRDARVLGRRGAGGRVEVVEVGREVVVELERLRGHDSCAVVRLDLGREGERRGGLGAGRIRLFVCRRREDRCLSQIVAFVDPEPVKQDEQAVVEPGDQCLVLDAPVLHLAARGQRPDARQNERQRDPRLEAAGLEKPLVGILLGVNDGVHDEVDRPPVGQQPGRLLLDGDGGEHRERELGRVDHMRALEKDETQPPVFGRRDRGKGPDERADDVRGLLEHGALAVPSAAGLPGAVFQL